MRVGTRSSASPFTLMKNSPGARAPIANTAWSFATVACATAVPDVSSKSAAVIAVAFTVSGSVSSAGSSDSVSVGGGGASGGWGSGGAASGAGGRASGGAASGGELVEEPPPHATHATADPNASAILVAIRSCVDMARRCCSQRAVKETCMTPVRASAHSKRMTPPWRAWKDICTTMGRGPRAPATHRLRPPSRCAQEIRVAGAPASGLPRLDPPQREVDPERGQRHRTDRREEPALPEAVLLPRGVDELLALFRGRARRIRQAIERVLVEAVDAFARLDERLLELAEHVRERLDVEALLRQLLALDGVRRHRPG